MRQLKAALQFFQSQKQSWIKQSREKRKSFNAFQSWQMEAFLLIALSSIPVPIPNFPVSTFFSSVTFQP